MQLIDDLAFDRVALQLAILDLEKLFLDLTFVHGFYCADQIAEYGASFYQRLRLLAHVVEKFGFAGKKKIQNVEFHSKPRIIPGEERKPV
jgi:hypothetical protein